MKNFFNLRLFKTVVSSCVIAFIFLLQGNIFAQTNTQIKNYVVYSGSQDATKNGVEIGTGQTISGGGFIGSTQNIISSGALQLTGSIFSAGRINLAAYNNVTGNISAGVPGTPNLTGSLFQTGTDARITGNVDVNGNISINPTRSSVTGIVTKPAGASYTGPGSAVNGTPNIRLMPALPAVTDFTNFQPGTTNITNSRTVTPINPSVAGSGRYNNMTLNGNKTITFSGTGTYVFNSITNSGNFNTFVFDFLGNTTGNIIIYIHGNVDLFKLEVQIKNGGSASRIFAETHGTGTGNATSGVAAWKHTNGTSGSKNSQWMGTVWAPYGNIVVGSGPQNSIIVGALWSGKQVILGGNLNLTSAPFNICAAPVVNAGPDKTTTCPAGGNILLEGSATNTSGASYSWTLNGNVVGTTPSINVTTAGTYRLTVTNADGCSAFDEVVVTEASCIILPQYPYPANGKTQTFNLGSELDALCRIQTLLNGPAPGVALLEDDDLRAIYKFEGTDESNILVYVEITASVSSPAAAASEVASLKAELISKTGMSGFIDNGPASITISGKIPINKICLLEEDPILAAKITDAIPLFPGVIGGQGAAISGGDSAMQSDKIREGFGLKGDGIKIGVISDSYNSYELRNLTPNASGDILTGDLPGATNPNSLLSPVKVLKDLNSGTDEGRAMLQIIHDIAPKADLYFRTGYINAYDFALGIKQLVDSGCNAVVDDVTYFAQPFFRDGIVSKAVDAAAASGVAYFTSAGNFGNKAYEGIFNTQNAPAGILSREPNAKAHGYTNSDIFQRIFLEQGAYTIVLQWDDDFYSLGGNAGAQKDLDIYLTDDNGNTLFGFNKNNIGKDPVEVLAFTATASAFTNIMVVSATGATNVRFKYVVFRGKDRLTFSEHDNKGGTIVGHASAAGALTVGAVRYIDNLPYLEDFSSKGGTDITLATGQAPQARNKPDFAAPNGVDNTFLGSNDFNNNSKPEFFGTSAAAPHAAAVAALLMEAQDKFYRLPTMSKTDFFKTVFTPVHLRTLLQDYAEPVTKLVSEQLYPTGSPVPVTPDLAGKGAINALKAISTFSNARPIISEGGIDTIPTGDSIKVIITGEYLDPNTTIFIGGVEQLESQVNESLTQVTVTIKSIEGNPSFQLYTPPQAGTNGSDGGLSLPRYLTDASIKTVLIEALPASKKFGEVLPDFSAKITMYSNIVDANGLAQTIKTEYTYPDRSVNAEAVNAQTLQAIGLANLNIVSTANNLTKVGSTPAPSIDAVPTLLEGSASSFRYLNKNASLTINPMPIKIVAFQKKDPNAPLIYGQPIRGIQFLYIMDESKLGDATQKAAFRKAVMLRHQLPINPRAYALIKDRSVALKSGVNATLSPADLTNMAAMVSENSISEAEAIINSEAEAIINSELEAIINSEAEAIINDAELEAIINSETEAIINSEDLDVNYAVGKDTIPNILVNVSVKNLFAYQDAPNVATLSSESEAIINALSIVEAEAIINSESEAIINSELEAIINSEAEAIINNEPVGEGNVILNGVFLDVNAIAANSELEAIINANVFESEAIINSEVEAIINDAEVEAIINTEAIINSEAEAIINETEAIINSTGAESEAIVNGFNNLGSSALNSKTVNDSSNANVMVAFNNDYPEGATSIKLRPVTMITGVEAGKHYVIPPAFFSENFVVTYGVGDFEIEKAKLDVVVTSTASAITYGAPLPNVGLKFDISSKWYKNSLPKDVFSSLKIKLYNGNSPVVGLPGASTTPYSIKPEILLKDNIVLNNNFGSNYELGTITNAELTVSPAALTVSVVDTSRVYGAANPVYRLVYSGLLNGETLASAVTSAPVASTTAVQSSPVDADPLTDGIQTYPITLSGGTSANYTFNFVPGNLTITPATLTATAQPKSREYFTDNPTFTIAYSGFVVAGENETNAITTAPVAATTAVKESNAGQYPITLSGGTASNYVFNLVNGILTVNKVKLTVKADDKQWYDNQSAPIDNGTFFTRTITGFRNNDTEASVELGTTSYSVLNYQMKTGTYTIRPSGTSLPAVTNYFIEHKDGLLYVNDDKAKKITTTLKCVEQLSTPINGFSYRATFTYDNPNTTDVFVPLGDKNFLEGASYDQSTPPPTLFKRTDGEYKLLFNGTVRWVLVTNSLNTNTQSTSAPRADETSPRCTIGGAVASGGSLQLNNQPVDQALTLTENKYSVYPNPVSNRLTVTSAMQSLKSTDISIYDLQGKLYRVNTTRQVTSNKVELDISPLANGVYMIRVNTGTENKVFRIIKQ